jgi:hypothetical protein
VTTNAEWDVLAHGPVQRLEDNLMRVEGALPNMGLKRVMTVARRADGGVVVHNAIAMEEAAMAEIEAWGRPTFIVVPNGFHRLDAAKFKARYPEAKIVCPRGAKPKVAKVVGVDLVYEELPPDDDVEIHNLPGTKDAEGVMIVRHDDAVTLVFNDAVFNMPHLSGVEGFVLRRLTSSTGGPRVSRVSRLFLVKDKTAFADELRRLADTPGLRRIIVSHHEVIDVEPARVLREVAATVASPG